MRVVLGGETRREEIGLWAGLGSKKARLLWIAASAALRLRLRRRGRGSKREKRRDNRMARHGATRKRAPMSLCHDATQNTGFDSASSCLQLSPFSPCVR
jgi:hypothetical protein